MLPITKGHAIQLLVDSAGILERCDDEGAQNLAAEIRDATKYSVYAIAAQRTRREKRVAAEEPAWKKARREKREAKLTEALSKRAAVETRKAANAERAKEMASMYQQGLVLERIGEHFGVTRERVRQILRKLGVTRHDGGQHKCVEQERAAVQQQRDARSIGKWGFPCAAMKAYRASGTQRAFIQQREGARMRGIEWKLSFPQWLEVWERSGKFEKRGRRKGSYVMSRIKDEGGYVFGNVHVQLGSVNCRDGVNKCRTNKAEFTGVWRLYPGSAKPWIAKVCKKLVGSFATQAEAASARAAYLRDNPETRTRIDGRGYSELKGTKGRAARFQVMVGAKYVGTYKTPTLALAARQAFIDSQSEAAAAQAA